jgi:hypothetical protein
MSDVLVRIIKAEAEQPLVYGWGSVCKVRDSAGQFVDYWDTDNESFPEDVTEKAWRGFMKNARHMDVMHDEKPMGRVVYAMPMTEEIAKSFGVLDSLKQTGVMVGVEVTDPEVLGKFRSGEYTGFSIGGSARFDDAV